MPSCFGRVDHYFGKVEFSNVVGEFYQGDYDFGHVCHYLGKVEFPKVVGKFYQGDFDFGRVCHYFPWSWANFMRATLT